MAEIITRQLGPKGINCLYNGVVDENMKQLPSLESLTNQIFIRVSVLLKFTNCDA